MTDPKDYAAQLERYERMVATKPEVERKGKTMPYTSHNGHMFSFLGKDGTVALRLAKEDREAFVGKYDTEPVVSYGAVMKEYVEVPQELLEDVETLRRYFSMSYEYTDTLKPK